MEITKVENNKCYDFQAIEKLVSLNYILRHTSTPLSKCGHLPVPCPAYIIWPSSGINTLLQKIFISRICF